MNYEVDFSTKKSLKIPESKFVAGQSFVINGTPEKGTPDIELISIEYVYWDNTNLTWKYKICYSGELTNAMTESELENYIIN